MGFGYGRYDGASGNDTDTDSDPDSDQPEMRANRMTWDLRSGWSDPQHKPESDIAAPVVRSIIVPVG